MGSGRCSEKICYSVSTSARETYILATYHHRCSLELPSLAVAKPVPLRETLPHKKRSVTRACAVSSDIILLFCLHTGRVITCRACDSHARNAVVKRGHNAHTDRLYVLCFLNWWSFITWFHLITFNVFLARPCVISSPVLPYCVTIKAASHCYSLTSFLHQRYHRNSYYYWMSSLNPHSTFHTSQPPTLVSVCCFISH